MNEPKQNESAEATDETLKEDEDETEAALDEKDLDGVAGGGFYAVIQPPLPPPAG